MGLHRIHGFLVIPVDHWLPIIYIGIRSFPADQTISLVAAQRNIGPVLGGKVDLTLTDYLIKSGLHTIDH